MDRYEIRIEFQTNMLGTTPPNEVYTEWLADKNPDVEEEALDEEATTAPTKAEVSPGTGFHKTPDGQPLIYDYVIKGFLKEACGALRRVKGTRSSKLQAYKKVIDGLIFVYPRQILLDTQGQPLGWFQRPLRASTPRGDRMALAASETVPEGTTAHFEIHVLGVVDQDLLVEWLNYGALSGLGAWRASGGWGRFTYELDLGGDVPRAQKPAPPPRPTILKT